MIETALCKAYITSTKCIMHIILARKATNVLMDAHLLTSRRERRESDNSDNSWVQSTLIRTFISERTYK